MKGNNKGLYPSHTSLVPLPVTLVPPCVVPTVDAGPRPLVAHLGVSVTLAGATVGEAPVTHRAPVTALTESTRPAPALTREPVAGPRHGAL